MEAGHEPSLETIAWIRSLMERFDAYVVITAIGELQFELSGPAAAAA